MVSISQYLTSGLSAYEMPV